MKTVYMITYDFSVRYLVRIHAIYGKLATRILFSLKIHTNIILIIYSLIQNHFDLYH